MSKALDDKILEINSIQTLPDHDYDWVWNYAQFRFSQSTSDINKAEEKANGLIKLIAYGFGVFWVLFLYFFKDGKLFVIDAFNRQIVIGLIGLCLSAVLVLASLFPSKRALPCPEELAIQFINENPQGSGRPKGRFSLGLMVCSDFQVRAATWKSWCVLIGFIFLVVSLVILSWGFYLWMLLQTS